MKHAAALPLLLLTLAAAPATRPTTVAARRPLDQFAHAFAAASRDVVLPAMDRQVAIVDGSLAWRQVGDLGVVTYDSRPLIGEPRRPWHFRFAFVDRGDRWEPQGPGTVDRGQGVQGLDWATQFVTAAVATANRPEPAPATRPATVPAGTPVPFDRFAATFTSVYAARLGQFARVLLAESKPPVGLLMIEATDRVGDAGHQRWHKVTFELMGDRWVPVLAEVEAGTVRDAAGDPAPVYRQLGAAGLADLADLAATVGDQLRAGSDLVIVWDRPHATTRPAAE